MSEPEINWKQRALDAEALVTAKDKNLSMKEEWLQEWKRVAEELKAQIPAANRLCSELEKWKQRAEAAEKACSEMREAVETLLEHYDETTMVPVQMFDALKEALNHARK